MPSSGLTAAYYALQFGGLTMMGLNLLLDLDSWLLIPHAHLRISASFLIETPRSEHCFDIWNSIHQYFLGSPEPCRPLGSQINIRGSGAL